MNKISFFLALAVLQWTWHPGIWQWLWDRICVGYLYWLDSGKSQWLKHIGGSWNRTVMKCGYVPVNSSVFFGSYSAFIHTVHVLSQGTRDIRRREKRTFRLIFFPVIPVPLPLSLSRFRAGDINIPLPQWVLNLEKSRSCLALLVQKYKFWHLLLVRQVLNLEKSVPQWMNEF